MNCKLSIVLTWILLLFIDKAFATDVRGRVDSRNPYNGYYQPLPKAKVSLLRANGLPLLSTYSGVDGFYYFYGVPAGTYVLAVNNIKKATVNIPDRAAHDIGPVLFRR